MNAGVLTSYPGIAIQLPHVSRNRELIAADGTLAKGYHLSWQHYPDDLKSVCELAHKELEAETQRLIKLLMWYFNTSHVHDPVQHVALYCSTGGKNYHAIKLSDSTQGVWQNDIVWSGVNSAGFSSVWKSKSEESLAHELFREAGSIVQSAPRRDFP